MGSDRQRISGSGSPPSTSLVLSLFEPCFLPLQRREGRFPSGPWRPGTSGPGEAQQNESTKWAMRIRGGKLRVSLRHSAEPYQLEGGARSDWKGHARPQGPGESRDIWYSGPRPMLSSLLGTFSSLFHLVSASFKAQPTHHLCSQVFLITLYQLEMAFGCDHYSGLNS